MDLSNLTDEQLVELQANIEATKKKRDQKEKSAHRQHVLDTYGVKIVCPTCEGTGVSYPPRWEPGDYPDNCRTCDSYGYIWAPKYAPVLNNSSALRKEVLQEFDTYLELG